MLRGSKPQTFPTLDNPINARDRSRARERHQERLNKSHKRIENEKPYTYNLIRGQHQFTLPYDRAQSINTENKSLLTRLNAIKPAIFHTAINPLTTLSTCHSAPILHKKDGSRPNKYAILRSEEVQRQNKHLVTALTHITTKTGPYHETKITSQHTQPKSLLSPYRQRELAKTYKKQPTRQVLRVHSGMKQQQQQPQQQQQQQQHHPQQHQQQQEDSYADETWDEEKQESSPTQESQSPTNRINHNPNDGIHVITRISGQTVLLCVYERSEPHVLDVYAYHGFNSYEHHLCIRFDHLSEFYASYPSLMSSEMRSQLITLLCHRLYFIYAPARYASLASRVTLHPDMIDDRMLLAMKLCINLDINDAPPTHVIMDVLNYGVDTSDMMMNAMYGIISSHEPALHNHMMNIRDVTGIYEILEKWAMNNGTSIGNELKTLAEAIQDIDDYTQPQPVTTILSQPASGHDTPQTISSLNIPSELTPLEQQRHITNTYVTPFLQQLDERARASGMIQQQGDGDGINTSYDTTTNITNTNDATYDTTATTDTSYDTDVPQDVTANDVNVTSDAVQGMNLNDLEQVVDGENTAVVEDTYEDSYADSVTDTTTQQTQEVPEEAVATE